MATLLDMASSSTPLSPGSTPVRRVPPGGRLQQLTVDTGYLVIGFPVSLATFAIVLTGLALGAGLLVIWIGVPVLAATLLAARSMATVERARASAVLGQPLDTPAYARADHAGPSSRLTAPLRDPQSWRDAAHATLSLFVAIPTFVVTVTLWAAAVGD